MAYTSVKVWSATMAKDREVLGDRIGAWLKNNPQIKIVDTVVTQSSDNSFHMLAITILYNEA